MPYAQVVSVATFSTAGVDMASSLEVVGGVLVGTRSCKMASSMSTLIMMELEKRKLSLVLVVHGVQEQDLVDL